MFLMILPTNDSTNSEHIYKRFYTNVHKCITMYNYQELILIQSSLAVPYIYKFVDSVRVEKYFWATHTIFNA